MGVASLVLGIVGLVFSFIPCLGLYGIFLTVPGLVLGAVGVAKASKSGAPKGLAIAGLVCSIIGSAFAGYQWYVLNKAKDAVIDVSKIVSEGAAALDKAGKEAAKEIQKEAAKLDEAAKKPAE